MYLPEIDLTKRLQKDGCLQPESFNCEREILPYIRGRKRFTELLKKTDGIKNNGLSSDVFCKYFNKHILIHCPNINDGLLATVLLYNTINVKFGTNCYISEYVIDRSRISAAPGLAGNIPVNPKPPQLVFVPPNARPGRIGFTPFAGDEFNDFDDGDLFDEDDEAEYDESDTEITAELFFCHCSDHEELSKHDVGGENLCIFIYSDEDMESNTFDTSAISDPKQEAARLHCSYIEIPPDSKEDLKSLMQDYFAKQMFHTSKVSKELERLLSLPYVKNDAQAIAAARNIINRHIEDCGDDQNLIPSDFSDYFTVGREKSRSRENRIVGLEKERKALDSMTDMLMFNIERKSMKLSEEDVSCNMVFAGPPGTAKTTLARIFAKKLSDLGVIPGEKNFRECTKSDIVGVYVGQTASKVDNLFREMYESGGGVIFFDEIYNISENNATCYDTEALNCITQNIENYRGSVFCIFAGYENKMCEFIEKNPGLSSRISATIIFSGYTDEMLCEIFNSFIEAENLRAEGEYKTMLREFFSYLRKKKGEGFGNGREARNLFEAAKRAMASRIYAGKKRDAKTMSTVLASDIKNAAEELLTAVINEKHIAARIGF